MTNNELFNLLPVLSRSKVCLPGTIDPETSDKLIDLLCLLESEADELKKRIDLIREQTRPEDIEEGKEPTPEQTACWERAFGVQMDLLGEKTSSISFVPLSAEEFRQLTAANTFIGMQAAVLKRTIVERKEEEQA